MIHVVTGTRYGRLLVVRELEPVTVGATRESKRVFEVKCDCGTVCKAKLASLRHGMKQSCGCLQREAAAAHCRATRPKPAGEAAFNALLNGYRQGAKSRSYPFELSVEQFKTLVQGDCFFCGQPPLNVMKQRQMNGSFVYNGIDRLDNALGYTSDNCVSCCSTCNRAKRTMGFEDFRAWIARVHRHLFT